MRKSYLFLLLFFIVSIGKAQVLEDLQSQWENGGESSLFESNDRLKLTLDLNSFPMSIISIGIPDGTVVFLGEKLWFFTEKDTLLNTSLAEYRKLVKEPKVDLTLFRSGISADLVSAKKVLRLEKPVEAVDGQLVNIEKLGLNRQEVKDFFTFSLMIILIITTAYKSAYPYIFTVIARPISLLKAEDFSDSGSLQKFFSFDVLFFVLMVNMMSAVAMILSVVFFKEAWLEARIPINFQNLMIGWGIGSLTLFVLTVIKFTMIRIIAYLFELGKIEFAHFFYLLRLVLIATIALILVMAYFIMNDFYLVKTALSISITVFFWLYIVGIIVLFIIMMNRLSFKKYHLFTYLCLAELVPFLILAKWVIVTGG